MKFEIGHESVISNKGEWLNEKICIKHNGELQHMVGYIIHNEYPFPGLPELTKEDAIKMAEDICTAYNATVSLGWLNNQGE